MDALAGKDTIKTDLNQAENSSPLRSSSVTDPANRDNQREQKFANENKTILGSSDIQSKGDDASLANS